MSRTVRPVAFTPAASLRLNRWPGNGAAGGLPSRQRFAHKRSASLGPFGLTSPRDGKPRRISANEWVRRTSMEGAVPSTGGVDGGDGGSGSNKSTDEEDGDDSDKSPLDALIEGGATMKDLPKDMQAAMKDGRMTVDMVNRWLAILATPILGQVCKAMPGFRDRVMGNPRFLLQLCLEVVLGLSAKTIAEVEARKDKFFQEIPFVLSDLALEVLGNITLVCLLSSKVSFKPAPSSGAVAAISSLPGHMLQKGDFSLAQRSMTLLYRGGQFFLVGFGTSMVGHSITKAAIEQRAKESGGNDEVVELAPVLDNSIGWGSFMASSSNTRYQAVNFIEESILDVFVPNKLLNVPITFGLRFTNCFLGGVNWIWYAKILGLQ